MTFFYLTFAKMVKSGVSSLFSREGRQYNELTPIISTDYFETAKVDVVQVDAVLLQPLAQGREYDLNS